MLLNYLFVSILILTGGYTWGFVDGLQKPDSFVQSVFEPNITALVDN